MDTLRGPVRSVSNKQDILAGWAAALIVFAIGSHRPDVASKFVTMFKNDLPAIRRPVGTLRETEVPPFIYSDRWN